jgi:hypothetical protein
MSIPKCAHTGPEAMNTITAANNVMLFFIGFSFCFFAEGKNRATGLRRLHDAQPSWLR